MELREKCKHHRTALIGGPPYCHEWCYECGALRRMKFISESTFTSQTVWQRPGGRGCRNPFPLKVIRGKE